MSKLRRTGYLPIESYGVIGNLRTAALVGLDGSIDWCCMPELDSPSVFGAILDRARGGCFRVAPAGKWTSAQRYREGTNVLETSFLAEGGRLTVTDFLPLWDTIVGANDPVTAPEIHRVVRCEEGSIEVEVEWSPRFDYARSPGRVIEVSGGYLAIAGAHRLALGGISRDIAEVREEEHGPVVRARIRLAAGDSLPLLTRYNAECAPTDHARSEARLRETVRVWQEWTSEGERLESPALDGRWHDQLVRSALVLKLLSHPDSGAIAAAASTSLPEEIGGVRNWDYRFSWIRDAAFTAQALVALGHDAEALDFLIWAEAVCMHDSAGADLQIMYGLHGQTELPEIELSHLEGYRGSRPVRIGNGAAKQKQLDIYGELLGAAYEYLRLGGQLGPSVRAFLAAVADRAATAWREPDEGIWEVRGPPRHFVYSKVMCWVALDRAVRMAERWGLRGRVGLWRRERNAVRRAILAEGFDADVGAFVQSVGSTALDASNLLIPVLEFLPFDDARVQGTIDRILEHLTEDGLVYRYRAPDGLPGGEGAFVLCTFWLADALTLSGRRAEARDIFNGMAERANHLGLYAEEIDPRNGQFLGNFPQAFSHIGFINSALYLARCHGLPARGPAPIGSRAHREETGHDAGAAA
jgi:GH15 family glucan-1,4-alpha-glucosidase